MNNKQVIHVSTVHDTFDTRIFYKQCVSLSQHGFAVEFLTQAGQKKDLAAEYGVKLKFLPRIRNRIFRASILPLMAFLYCLVHRKDVYHFHDPELIWVALALSVIWRSSKVFFDVHENIKEDIRTKEYLRFKFLFLKLYSFVEDLSASRVRFILAEDSYVPSYIGKSYILVRNFPKLDLFQGSLAPDFKSQERLRGEIKFVYLGSVTVKRGILENLELLKSVLDTGQYATLTVIGPIDSNEDEIHDRIKVLGLAEHIFLLGRLPAVEAYRIVSNCDVALSILRDDPNLKDSYPTKLFEYIYIGLPVMASDFPLWREVIVSTGLGECVDPGNHADIVEGYSRCRNKLLTNGYLVGRARGIIMEKYSWESQAEVLVNSYNA